MVKTSQQSAVTESEFERLVAATDKLRHPFDAECLYILISGGRLGMRAGELSHADESWLNRERNQIEIPSYDKCDHSPDLGACGYCRLRARKAVEHNEDLDYETAIAQRWEPKTQASVRAIPYDFSDRVQTVIETFFDEFGRYCHSRTSVNRRVERVKEAAGMKNHDLHPHSLRATAATYHAYRGVPPIALQSFMGWSNLSVARKYLRLSGGSTAKALNEAHRG